VQSVSTTSTILRELVGLHAERYRRIFYFMGYTTDFTGSFSFDREMDVRHANYLRAFNKTRRMKRNPETAEKFPDVLRIAAGLPIGKDGGFYVGSSENYGQNRDESIMDYNTAPGQVQYSINEDFNARWKMNEELIANGDAQPGLWCQWTVSEDNMRLEWDGGEKFYNYIEWLKFIITNFLEPWGYKLSGKVEWVGEDSENDHGEIIVTDNLVLVVVNG